MAAANQMLRTGRRGGLHELSMAWADLAASLGKLGLAWSLAWHDVVSRYRGSILGPFWITLSMGTMVLGIGFLYSHLLRIPVAEFMPFVACGIVFWGLISTSISEGCQTFVQASGMLSQTSLPMLTFLWRTVLRNLVNLAHHIVIIVGVLVWYGLLDDANLPLALLGLVLVLLNISWISLAVGIWSARFRDVPQIVISVLQFAMFVTPVFWRPTDELIGHVFLAYNPFNHMLHAVRGPMLGDAPGPEFAILAFMALGGWTLAIAAFTLTRRRIVHYL